MSEVESGKRKKNRQIKKNQEYPNLIIVPDSRIF